MKNLKEVLRTVQAEFYEGTDELMLKADGHADFDVRGKDIVCAGISALCLMLKISVDKAVGDNKDHMVCSISDGMFYLAVNNLPFMGKADEIRALFSGCFEGICAIAQLYPANVKTHKLLIPFGVE